MIIFGCMNHQKRNLTRLSKALEFLQLVFVELANTFTPVKCKRSIKKGFNGYKEKISAAYNVLDIEIEEPPPIYDRDTKNKAEELDRLHMLL